MSGAASGQSTEEHKLETFDEGMSNQHEMVQRHMYVIYLTAHMVITGKIDNPMERCAYYAYAGSALALQRVRAGLGLDR
jgi:hypothetical protein